jgi:hypothetical protein
MGETMLSSDTSEPDNPSQSTRRESFHATGIQLVAVSPSRLAWGCHDHTRRRDIGEGDIYAAYSADTIAFAGKIRKPFRWQGQTMITVSLCGRGESSEAEAYRLLPLKAFAGIPVTYGQKTGTADSAESARNDPNGFYHGLLVKQGGESIVLVGPPVVFVAADEAHRPARSEALAFEQLSLF